MPHLFSGLNQKQQSGKITNGTFIISNTKGRGSTTRMLNYCNQTSEAPSNCINQFVSLAPQATVSNNFLFDTSTFNSLFDIYGTGFRPIISPPDPKYKPIPYTLKEALNVGVNRWSKFLSYNPDMVNLIRTFPTQVGYPGPLTNWNGLILLSVEYKDYPPLDENTWASCSPLYVDGLATSMNYGFTLSINKKLYNANGTLQISQNLLNTIIAHELGHALCMTLNLSCVNGDATGEELLPNVYIGALSNYEEDAPSYSKDYYPKALEAFNSIGGWANYSHAHTLPNELIPLSTTDDGGHWQSETLYKLNNGVPDLTVFYRGFFNELMNPFLDDNKQYYISQLTINALRDIYTSWQGKIHYNYTYKGGNETSGKIYQAVTNLIEFY